jgi:cell division septum initiation protein DivIVA
MAELIEKIKISELTETTTADDASYIPIDNGNVTYKITVANYNSGANATAKSYAEASAASATAAAGSATYVENALDEVQNIYSDFEDEKLDLLNQFSSITQSVQSASNSATRAAASATSASTSAQNCATIETSVREGVTLAESWAVGGTNTREGEDTNNSKYYAEQASAAASSATVAQTGAETAAASAVASATAAASSATDSASSATAAAKSATAAEGSAMEAAASASQAATDITELKNDLDRAELATSEVAEPIITRWLQKSLNANTGVESPSISTKSIITDFYPIDAATSLQFTGVIRGTDETADRQHYTYCYSADKTYLGRTNRQLLSGTKFVRFLYGFLSGSPLTVDGYGFDNLVADWSMTFTPTYKSRLAELEAHSTATDTAIAQLNGTDQSIQAFVIRNALAVIKNAVPETVESDWSDGTINTSTGLEQDNIRQIRTGYYPVSEKTAMVFSGIVRGSGETADRQYYTYCYDQNHTYIGRTNRGLLDGTCFVRFTYGFLSSSDNTVESYGKSNLIADWGMSFDNIYDDVINVYDGDISNFETAEWYENQLDISDFLKFEKTSCLHHDNFARANNSTDIGYNGTDQTVYNVPPYKMEYGTMSAGSGNLNVGISNNRAVGRGGSTGDVVIKTVDAVSYPYKVIVSALTEGEFAIGAISASEFVSIVFNANTVSLVNNGSKEIWVSRETKHYSSVSAYTVYVYKNRIAVYNCGVKMFEAPADMQSTICGIVFRREKNSTYKYTCFDVFNPSEWMQDGLNPAIEQYSLSAFNVSENVEARNENALRSFGQLQTGTIYGITLDAENTLRSKRSMRFELRYGDPIVSSGARSEIVPIRPKGNEITLHSKILDFDIMFGDDYDADTGEDIIMQMHDLPDGINMAGLSPGIALKIISNVLYLSTMGTGIKVLADSDRPTQKLTQIATVEKNVWHHITVYLREGYMEIHNPVTAVWYDGELKTVDYGLNCYNEARGSYPKFGIYKSWMHGATQTTKRTLWIDNINLWY